MMTDGRADVCIEIAATLLAFGRRSLNRTIAELAIEAEDHGAVEVVDAIVARANEMRGELVAELLYGGGDDDSAEPAVPPVRH
jgi:hypothetical protein